MGLQNRIVMAPQFRDHRGLLRASEPTRVKGRKTMLPNTLCIGMYGLNEWFGNDFRPVLDLIAVADQIGIDQINVPDHIVMGEATDNYPYGKFVTPPDYPWIEPLTLLASAAGKTARIRLSTGIIIAPLRAAVVFAKQAASLDVLSGGRLDLGVGVGWQREEYVACGLPFEARYALLDEQMRICRRLWSEAPASFSGRFVSFERIYSKPFPRQRRLPVLLGLAPTPKNAARIAEYADGWLPLRETAEEVRSGVLTLRDAFRAAGRDPLELQVRAVPQFEFRADGLADLEWTLAQIPPLLRAGATGVELYACMFCRSPREFETFCERLVAFKSELPKAAA
jgi:probable F420-dependent oxidoreductase